MRGALRSLCVLAALVCTVGCGDEEGSSDPNTGDSGNDGTDHQQHPQGDAGDQQSGPNDGGANTTPPLQGGPDAGKSHSSRVRFSWQGV